MAMCMLHIYQGSNYEDYLTKHFLNGIFYIAYEAAFPK